MACNPSQIAAVHVHFHRPLAHTFRVTLLFRFRRVLAIAMHTTIALRTCTRCSRFVLAVCLLAIRTSFHDPILAHPVGHSQNFKAHLFYTSRDGRLTVDKVIASSGNPAGKHIYMCGPIKMVEAFRDSFTKTGLKAGDIHYEEFNFR